MTKVISESNYSSHSQAKRTSSVGSQRSMDNFSNQTRQTSQLEQLLSRKSHNPGSSHKQFRSSQPAFNQESDQLLEQQYAQSVDLFGAEA